MPTKAKIRKNGPFFTYDLKPEGHVGFPNTTLTRFTTRQDAKDAIERQGFELVTTWK